VSPVSFNLEHREIFGHTKASLLKRKFPTLKRGRILTGIIEARVKKWRGCGYMQIL
jgi:hypothetical protein